MAEAFTPYTTGAGLFGVKPNWLQDDLDIQRIQSYQLYEEMYWNVPQALRVALRGSTNSKPLYIPSARIIVDTTARFTAPRLRPMITDRANPGDPTADVMAARLALSDFMKRERFASRFAGNKRYGLIRGDWLWHVTANPNKPAGSRISLTAIDPGQYFPIVADDDVDQIVGCHLVELLALPQGQRIKRQTYRKVFNADGTNGVTVEVGLFEVDKWGGPSAKPETVIRPVELMPGISSLPVYHVKNFEEPGNPFGSSEVRGLESLILGINQVMSDEDLALALDGIGLYATDANQPIHPTTGEPMPWMLGPGRVVHADGTFFNRVSGVDSSGIKAFGDHYNRMVQAVREAAATPDIAVGVVDVSVAQSGIALALQLGPMTAKAAEKNDIIIDVHNNLFYDILGQWFPAYEGTTFNDLVVDCLVGEAIPADREQSFAELNDMLDRGVIDAEFYRTKATELGYQFPETMDTEQSEETPDPDGDRLNAESADGVS